MTLSICRRFIILLAFSSCAGLAGAQEKRIPLNKSELLALVAGNALSENIAHEIESRGLAFQATDTYRFQLATAGADARVLAALGKATISSSNEAADDKDSAELLQHLSAAGKLMRFKQYQEAAEQLNGALQANGSAEAGFVMGELLKVQEQWPMAASVYQQVLKQNPGFPEAHTKLSYVMYRLGDPEEGLREAKTALTRTSENAEAHKNAGLLLQTMRKFDAGAEEFWA
jgi:tetratricopeptide (TPR) repeat protein